MTIEEIKQKVTNRDLVIRSVWIQTTLLPYPLRLVRIGRKYLEIMNRSGVVVKAYPDIVTEIRM